jgi:hypothetical protein
MNPLKSVLAGLSLRKANRSAKAVIFLHIPKTAGQSTHRYLEKLFDPHDVCPARENDKLLTIPAARLQRYRLFSGHLDWSLLDVVPQPRFVFTILREPRERLLSFYFFMRRTAATLPKEQLELKHTTRAALTLTPDEYFCGGPHLIRQAIDSLHDNFYTYYFAGRTFDARRKLKDYMAREFKEKSEDKLVELALSNMRMLDRVYTIDQLDRLEMHLRREIGISETGISIGRVNKGEGDFSSRLSTLRELGATDRTFDRLKEMTRLDDRIWREYTQ